jgi:RecG-like helicase
MSLQGRKVEEKSGAPLEKKRRRVEKLMKNLPFSLTKKTTKKNNNNNLKQLFHTTTTRTTTT